MKRFLAIVCMCGLLMAWGLPCGVQAAEFDYTVSDGQVTITGWNASASGVVTVPAVVDGYPVTAIADYAFLQCVDLTEVYLPDSVATIGEAAFWGCENLQTIHLPDTMTSLGFSAFAYCSNLNEIRIPDGISELPESLFLLCESLQTVTIPGSVTVIGDFAFNQCSSLTTVTLEDGVQVIGQAAFAWCTSLTTVTLPNSVTTIQDNAFYSCNALTWVASQEVFAYIESLEDFDLSMLQGVVMPMALTDLGETAFSNCTGLWYIVFPDDAPNFGEFCFEGVVATVFYHAGNPTWTEDVKQDYGGTLYWMGIHAFANYVSDGNATCTTDGTKTAKCELCDATDTVTDEGTKGHQYVNNVCIFCGDQAAGLLGDVNGDGKVNMADVAKVFAHVRNKNELTDETALLCADVTGDGKINMADVARIFAHARGTNPLF